MGRITKRHEGSISWVGPSPDRSNLRWITRVDPGGGGRAYARAPKRRTPINDLRLRRDSDFGPERAVPAGHVVTLVLFRGGDAG